MPLIRRLSAVLLLALAPCSLADQQNSPFDAPILNVRPRVFIRSGDFDGLTVEKLRRAAQLKEFASIRPRWQSRPLGRAHGSN